MYHTFSHNRNANQNNSVIPSHSSQNDCLQENKQQQILANKEKEILYLVGMNIN
jgi:hypothetical protein